MTSGVEHAIIQAKAVAGNKHVMVIGGASTAQQCIQAGLCDELQIGIVPILLGEGLRFFEHSDPKPLELERIKVIESPARIDLWFRIIN